MIQYPLSVSSPWEPSKPRPSPELDQEFQHNIVAFTVSKPHGDAVNGEAAPATSVVDSLSFRRSFDFDRNQTWATLDIIKTIGRSHDKIGDALESAVDTQTIRPLLWFQAGQFPAILDRTVSASSNPRIPTSESESEEEEEEEEEDQVDEEEENDEEDEDEEEEDDEDHMVEETHLEGGPDAERERVEVGDVRIDIEGASFNETNGESKMAVDEEERENGVGSAEQDIEQLRQKYLRSKSASSVSSSPTLLPETGTYYA